MRFQKALKLLARPRQGEFLILNFSPHFQRATLTLPGRKFYSRANYFSTSITFSLQRVFINSQSRYLSRLCFSYFLSKLIILTFEQVATLLFWVHTWYLSHELRLSRQASNTSPNILVNKWHPLGLIPTGWWDSNPLDSQTRLCQEANETSTRPEIW
jgi:hypothetical protein